MLIGKGNFGTEGQKLKCYSKRDLVVKWKRTAILDDIVPSQITQ